MSEDVSSQTTPDDVEALGRLDASSGWGEDRWDEVLGRYWDEYDWIGTDTSARAISLAPLDEAPDETALAAAGVSERLREALEASGKQVWLATQVLEDPDGDHDWRLTALVDLAARRRGARSPQAAERATKCASAILPAHCASVRRQSVRTASGQ